MRTLTFLLIALLPPSFNDLRGEVGTSGEGFRGGCGGGCGWFHGLDEVANQGDSVSTEGGFNQNARADDPSWEDVGYDSNIAGPHGYRRGYVWMDGSYTVVECEVGRAYTAPIGEWAGQKIVTQSDYAKYSAYATHPVETAVQVELRNLGIYSGPIDGNASSCSASVIQYQEQNRLPVTGSITHALLSAIGVQTSR